MKKLVLFLILANFQILNSQNSFIVELDSIYDTPGNSFDLEIGINNQNFLTTTHIDGGFRINSFDNLGNPINSFKIVLDSINEVIETNNYCNKKLNHLISFSTVTGSNQINGLCLLNFEEQNFWCKNLSFKTTSDFSTFSKILENTNGIVCPINNSTSQENSNSINVAKLSVDNGNTEWCYEYQDSSNIQKQNLIGITELNNGDIAFLLKKRKRSFLNDHGIVLISSKGEFKRSINIPGDSISINENLIFDKNNHIYISGNITSNNNTFRNNREGFIAKFNTDLELIWAKRLSAENFNSWKLDLTLNQKGTINFMYITFGDLPIIAGELDENGDLIRYSGYPFFQPKVKIGLDNSLIFLTRKKYYIDGNSERKMVLAKTNPDGTFDECNNYNACLSLFDLDISFNKTILQRDSFSVPDFLDFSIDTLQITTVNHCGTPRPPTPYFATPDTICQNQCLRPDSLYNHLAHAVEWTITGNDILFESQDTSFNYCFNEPGKYQIEQEVWLLGCSEFFTREVVVLPDSLGDLLGDDRLICDDTIAVLEPNTIRPLREYSWSDSTRDSSLTASESGIYGVEVSDGYCSASDEIELNFFDELFSGIDLELPTDTNICQELLPFTLTPKSDFSNEFFINGSTNPQSTFEIQTAGNYQISTKIEGCEITKDFNLGLVPCEVDIYIPSSFSPNNDGINDLLEPLGNDFMGKRLQIFDRWGGLLFETKEAPFAWDGSKVEEGVYVVTFSYLNLKNQREEMVSGDVLVVR